MKFSSQMQFDPTSSVVVVDAEVKALRSTITTLAVDTGSSYVVISWKLINALGIKINPKRILQITTATTVETVPQVTIPEVKVIGKSVRNVEGIVKDLPSESHVDGLLGLSFLKNFKITIDFKKGLLSLE
jgi:clan AA aspartic protease (TIGR02281 family)